MSIPWRSPPGPGIWSIGQGFTGSASDWTESPPLRCRGNDSLRRSPQNFHNTSTTIVQPNIKTLAREIPYSDVALLLRR